MDTPPTPSTAPRRLYRSKSERVIAGVCGGLAEYFNVDVTLVRVIFVALTLGGGFGFGLYILLWLIIPEAGSGQTMEQRVHAAGEEIRQHVEHAAHDIHEHRAQHHGRDTRSWLAAVIILIGVWLLVAQFVPINLFHWNLFWPLLLIIAGLYIITKR